MGKGTRSKPSPKVPGVAKGFGHGFSCGCQSGAETWGRDGTPPGDSHSRSSQGQGSPFGEENEDLEGEEMRAFIKTSNFKVVQLKCSPLV